MSSVTVSFSSLNESELRVVLLAHKREHEQHEQPRNVMAAYAQDHDGGLVGPIVRVEGPAAYTVVTLPLSAESAHRICECLAAQQISDVDMIAATA